MNNLRATRACDKLLPQDIEESANEQGELVRTVKNCELRLGFKLGYKTAEKETIDRAIGVLKNYCDTRKLYEGTKVKLIQFFQKAMEEA